MSRFTLICSLVFGLSSAALVDRADAHFAKAPPATQVAMADAPMSAELRIAPMPVDRAAVRAALVKARAKNLAAFRAYRAKGVFPNNTYKPRKLNVWLDEDGNFCAAATLIKMSGHDDLVSKIAEQNNFIRLADVEQGPLLDWILTSGFTQDEIAMIQEPFMPVVDVPDVEPKEPLLVDAKLRKAEDARLRAKYRAIDKQLVAKQKKSLALAVDRLMKHPALARTLIASQRA